MDQILEKGVQQGLITFDSERKNITYIKQGVRLRFNDSEERVRARAVVSLTTDYGYLPDQIEIEVPFKHGHQPIYADVVVYKDKTLKKPLIIIECKREEATQGELDQATEQAFSYANSLDADFVWITSGIRNDYFRRLRTAPRERVENRLADLPSPNGKVPTAKYVKGGVGGFELKTVEEIELTRIFKQAHDALWAGGKRNPSEAFDELDKLIFCKIWDERAKRKTGDPYDFQIMGTDSGDDLKRRIHNIYIEGRKKDEEVFKEDIRLSNSELQTVVGYLAATNLNKTDLDSKGRAFETFMTGFFRGEFGQYFTPRKIVQFIVDVLPINNDSMVLDTSCGSGGFLLHALDKVRKQADHKALEGYFDPTTPEGYKEHFDFWHDFAEHNLFGIEISEGIARTAKMNMIIHDDGHTNVIAFDGLEPVELMQVKTKNKNFKENAFDFIVTNPPFGSKVKYSEKRYMENYTLGKKGVDWIDAKLNNISLLRANVRDQQTTEVLFLEQCHRFLKPGGTLAMVVPDSILTNSSMQYVRDWIEEHWRILAVVSLPQFAFSANGAGVKSSVLFLKKHTEKTTAAIQAIKTKVQDDLFDKKSPGIALEALIEEKKAFIKRGDNIIQQIENDLVAKLDALEAQGTLTASEKREFKARAKEDIAAHKETEAFKDWQQRTNDNYNERIAALRETLEDEFLVKVKAQIEDYPIFMVMAENIGYDATGRPTAQNDLETVSRELGRFLESIERVETYNFCLPNGLDEDRAFIVSRKQIESRHDPYFYLPRFVRLEALVRSRSQAKLRDFIVAMSGGATPKAEEQAKYYADADSGVPFVRVQNLSVSGELALDDVKHINYETHHGLLARSQVKQDDLLIKITGVGRMAVASVPPQGFEGNINQHIVRIRTKDRATSEALAAWLNTDVAEALAKRRSTGGTRPALDYPALRSIPVILDERVEREMRTAYDEYKTALKQAEQQLESAKRRIEVILLGGVTP